MLPISKHTLQSISNGIVTFPNWNNAINTSGINTPNLPISHGFYNQNLSTNRSVTEKTLYENDKKLYNETLNKNLIVETQNDKLYKCNDCDNTFKKPADLNTHKLRHVVHKRYKCDICEKKFSNPDSLTSHLKLHLSKYKCNECEKTFLQSIDLYQHKKCHNEKLYKCEICDYIFMDENSLTQHKILHTVPYKCNECKEVFDNIKNLDAHLLQHEKGQEYVNNSFCDNSSTLKQHIKTPTNVYKCEECNRSFSRLTKLNIHKLDHQNRPYKCTECPLTFIHHDSLVIHQTKVFECRVCSLMVSGYHRFIEHRETHVI